MKCSHHGLFVQAVKRLLSLLGQGLPLDCMVIRPLADYIHRNVADFSMYELLLAWHGFAQLNHIELDFEAAVVDRMEEFLMSPSTSHSVYVVGKAIDVQVLWSFHDRVVAFPPEMKQAINDLHSVRSPCFIFAGGLSWSALPQ